MRSAASQADTDAPATRPAAGPRSFASAEPISHERLAAAPLRHARPSRLMEPLKDLTPKVASGLGSLGIVTVGDLLRHLPSQMRPGRTIAALKVGEQATVAVVVDSIRRRMLRTRGGRKLTLVEAVVSDETGSISATFFNQPWLLERYPPGSKLLLRGSLKGRRGFAVSDHALEGSDGLGDGGGDDGGGGERSAVAHYPAAEGVSPTQILTLMRSHRAALADVLDPLPGRLRAAYRLPDRSAALSAMHFPGDAQEQEQARRRLAFEELLLSQLMLRRQLKLHARGRATPLRGERDLTKRWVERELPFELTADQRSAIDEIDVDIAAQAPMRRLLMGEVGSGKTVVALHAMLRAVEHGRQAALMAPTETLSEQHFETLQRLAPRQALLRTALLTGSTPSARRRDILAKLGSGELQLLVGTHALIERDVAFRDLALVVVDEQHRFGVAQRAALASRGRSPHVLHMTATPIPRTLWLTRYGHLQVTQLKALPKGRRPIATHIASTGAERTRAYQRVREELAAGRQAFVVCPLVEESEQLQARAATAEHRRLSEGELKGFAVGLIHGQMKQRDKQEAMESFAQGRTQVLVATTVIEVGIDVPNATAMLIEDADRYGISQLHQLRGRVGRGEHPSLCLLFGDKSSRRLRALAQHSDGFRLAEIDLQLRGEGDLGDSGQSVRQSGQRELRVARLPQDALLLEDADACARDLLASDPYLAQPESLPLRDALRLLPA